MEPVTTSPLQQFVDRLPWAAVITTPDAENPIILVANRKHSLLTGYKASEVLNKSPRMFKGALTEKDVSDEIKEEMRLYHFSNVDVTNHRPDGQPYRIHMLIIGIVVDGQRYYCALKKPIV